MNIFTSDMAKRILEKRQDRILAIPDGVECLDGDFSDLFDEEKIIYHFKEMIIPGTVKEIKPIFLCSHSVVSEENLKCFEKITVRDDNMEFVSIDGVLYSKNKQKLICFPPGKMKIRFVVPDDVIIISEGAFRDNIFIETLILPEGLEEIESNAFAHAENLHEINLPDTCKHIGSDAFLFTNISRLKLPAGIKKIDCSVLEDCRVIEIPDQLEFIDAPESEFRDSFLPPLLLSHHNAAMEEFAKKYKYNFFNDYLIDENNIIWSVDKKTLIDFPDYWPDPVYEIPKETEYIFRWAFNNSYVDHISSAKEIILVGKSSGSDFSRLDSKDDYRYKNDFAVIKKGDSLMDGNGFESEHYAFISYSSKNQTMADATRILLKNSNIPCWMAPYDIPAGSKYAYVINDALENCACLVLLLTNDSQNSLFVEKEIERAITYKKPIITMMLEDVKLNSGFKFYIGDGQIVAVKNIDGNTEEMKKIISGIKSFLNQ